jgi:hypothetical protein
MNRFFLTQRRKSAKIFMLRVLASWREVRK